MKESQRFPISTSFLFSLFSFIFLFLSSPPSLSIFQTPKKVEHKEEEYEHSKFSTSILNRKGQNYPHYPTKGFSIA